eukprot:TRINITY_DN17577_c0_g1_i1.p1 TRINITY_DN17577_c0_g1~~TRINITY_DN17577_c0_g1_i1.p1  ORF type:complete len:432 (-),score=60.05 TRINITY_DN17577_c0_g1_i1:81-1376(-)
MGIARSSTRVDEQTTYSPLDRVQTAELVANEAEKYPASNLGKKREARRVPPATWESDYFAIRKMFLKGKNVLLLFSPVALLSSMLGVSSATIFTTNFLAVVPLAGILGEATESLSVHAGETLGGLINASFGNAVEMIITMDMIKEGLCSVVQGNLIGSILSNLLLVLGMSFVAAGIRTKDPRFNVHGASANASLLLLAGCGVVLPTLFDAKYEDVITVGSSLHVSRVCSLVMAMSYAMFLMFQLVTHKHHFVDSNAGPEETMDCGEDEEPELEAPLSALNSVILLMCATLLISQHSEPLVASIEDVSETYGIPKAFIGLILLPMVGNAAEHMTAVMSAYKGRMDLSLGVAVGSSTQVALLIVPYAIIMGWIYDQPMTLNFGGFYCGTLILAVFLVGAVLHDGETNWLEGVMLIALYGMIASICWFVPNEPE